MKRTILIFFTFFLTALPACTAQEMTPEMQEFLSRIDGASLEELEAELDQGIEGIRAFSDMFLVPGSVGIVDYATQKMEEQYEAPFKVDTTIVNKAMLQFDAMGFKQSFKNGKSEVKFQKIGDDYWNTIWMEEGMTDVYSPKAIHYKNGSTLTKGISDYDTSFFFEKPWGDIAIIDSIEIDYTIYYTAKYDSLLLTKKSKKIDFKDGVIKVKKLDKNYLYLTISDAYADGLYVNALNAEGKVLNSNSSSFSPTTDDRAGDGIGEILKLLEEVQGKLKQKKFKDVDGFKKYMLKKMANIEEAKDTDGVFHKKYYFEGNIETVKLYIETEEKSKTTSFTAKNNSDFGDIIFMQNKTHNIFYDANAKELFRQDYSPIQSIGSRYFQKDSLYYHLNLETKNLDALKVNRIWEATNGIAFIREKREDKFSMYGPDHRLLSELVFSDAYPIDKEYVQAVSDSVDYIINSKGVLKKMEGISGIRDPHDGRMAAKSKGKYGYIATSGEVVIPFIYIDATNFNDGFAIVAKEEHKYGLIDTNGKTVIPLIYFGVMSYENGIAWVSTGQGYNLIDTTGKVLVTAKGSSYSVSGSGLDKTYQFGDMTYDAFGKLIKTEK